jgi:putative membrane protein
MKTTSLFTLLFAASIYLSACNSPEQTNSDNTMAADSALDTISKGSQTDLSEDENKFIQQAAAGGMLEVELANQALQKSKNPKIKAFAQMMVTDHSNANLELQKVAENKGLQLPKTFPAEQQKHLDMMKEFADRGFDRQYMEMMESEHVATLALFRKAAQYGDIDIKNFAAKTIPVLEKHYKEASALNEEIQNQKVNNGDDNANVERDAKKTN